MLEFDPTLDELRKTKELRDGLSVMVQIGETLWVTNCSPRSPGPAAVEADLEGLAYANGYLRLVGSHSRKQEQVVGGETLRLLLTLPVGEGDDHPEGIGHYAAPGGGTRLIVVYDAAAAQRQVGASGVRADLVPVPPPGGEARA